MEAFFEGQMTVRQKALILPGHAHPLTQEL